ncbi:MAG: hypothetical protein K6U74_18900 [Firmicutes bacterium]|nr:hypothetical protein [Bacillota bacterium]
MVGYQAKKARKKAPKRDKFTWRGNIYQVGSPDHQGLMYLALWAKFTQNKTAHKALLATEGLVLTHVMPRDSVTIPGTIFAGMLMDIRKKLLEAEKSTITFIGRKEELKKYQREGFFSLLMPHRES